VGTSAKRVGVGGGESNSIVSYASLYNLSCPLLVCHRLLHRPVTDTSRDLRFPHCEKKMSGFCFSYSPLMVLGDCDLEVRCVEGNNRVVEILARPKANTITSNSYPSNHRACVEFALDTYDWDNERLVWTLQGTVVDGDVSYKAVASMNWNRTVMKIEAPTEPPFYLQANIKELRSGGDTGALMALLGVLCQPPQPPQPPHSTDFQGVYQHENKVDRGQELLFSTNAWFIFMQERLRRNATANSNSNSNANANANANAVEFPREPPKAPVKQPRRTQPNQLVQNTGMTTRSQTFARKKLQM
jgi:hypothetical protein